MFYPNTIHLLNCRVFNILIARVLEVILTSTLLLSSFQHKFNYIKQYPLWLLFLFLLITSLLGNGLLRRNYILVTPRSKTIVSIGHSLKWKGSKEQLLDWSCHATGNVLRDETNQQGFGVLPVKMKKKLMLYHNQGGSLRTQGCSRTLATIPLACVWLHSLC